MKILIVDDETLDLFIARTVLQTEFEVEGFSTLQECVAWATQNEFDAVLIDYYLDTDTYATDVLAALQKVKPHRIRNAFVLSSYVDNKLFNALKTAGFDGVISKPISLEIIRARLVIAH